MSITTETYKELSEAYPVLMDLSEEFEDGNVSMIHGFDREDKVVADSLSDAALFLSNIIHEWDRDSGSKRL